MKQRMNTLSLNTLFLMGLTASFPLYATSSTPSTPTVYSGTNQETSKAALAAFQEAVGGSNASKITWDGVKLGLFGNSRGEPQDIVLGKSRSSYSRS
ncbi:MAG: hypothetical protein BWK73_30585 [Thiothrix lacustris]|uniref:Uncharacterized protein n=1 Tax=Thiothrix lacustris TaxID=525917 RepID=A0A1Y1QIL1_9GAMM|nr:MAG: hypothetical protein BWK73_30585 [Thiothrix lacustris]